MTRHPSPETLLDLTLDDLSEEEASKVREHLLECQDCLDKVRDLLAESDEPPSAELRVKPEQRATAWQQLTAAIEAEGLTPPAERSPETVRPVLPFERPSAKPERTRPRLAGWQAAAAAAVAFGIGFLARPSGPEMPTSWPMSMALVEGDHDVTRGSSDPTRIECPSDQVGFAWTLLLADPPPKQQLLRFVVERPDGSKEAPVEMQANRLGQLIFVRRPGTTPPGRYIVRVYSRDPEPLESFYLLVTCDEPTGP